MKFYRKLASPQASKMPIKDDKGNIIGYKPLSPRMQLHHHRVISAILAKAKKWKYIKENPASIAEAPRVPYKESAYLDEEQAKRLIELLENQINPYKTMTMILLFTRNPSSAN